MKNLRYSTILIGLLFAGIVAVQAALVIDTSLRNGHNNLLLPLDDVYIHFQYARQLAEQQPYVYNPGSPPTSGATSFLYPYVLAVGYLAGFQGLLLGLWAILLGCILLWLSMVAVYRLLAVAPRHTALLTALIFGMQGALVWHYFSGMETGLVITLLLWTLVFYSERTLIPFTVVAALLALSRPESSVMALIAVLLMALRLKDDYPLPRLLVLLFPVSMIGIQPLVNLFLTGSMTASGSQAKSIFGAAGTALPDQIVRVFLQFVRIWTEWISGVSSNEGWYQFPLLGLGVLSVLVWLCVKREWRGIGLLLLLWMLALSGATATLDTAFWHFKRYQMPLYALSIVLAGWGAAALGQRYRNWHLLSRAALLILLITGGMLTRQFLAYYGINVSYLYNQPYQMALWLAGHTPEDAVIAVHDVGMMRYTGNRATLDIVGLTTPGAAVYWRNGPGSVAEYLLNQQPDYIASYGRGHGYGLAYLADTALYSPELATFTITDWQRAVNVALAADTQAIYQPDWQQIQVFRNRADAFVSELFPGAAGMRIVDRLNVADIASESEHAYRWLPDRASAGFSSVVLELPVAGCADCMLLEGARQFSGSEQFILRSDAATDEDLLLVSWVHANASGTVEVLVNGQPVGQRVIPEIPGHWVILATLLPAQVITPEMTIELIPLMRDDQPYMPARHLLLKGVYQAAAEPDTIRAAYQDGAFVLADTQISLAAGQMSVDLDWYSAGAAQGDYRLFVHVYADLNQPPVAQWDGYAANGSQPPGNWIHGERHDTISIGLPDLPAGLYRVAIGFYNPLYSDERLIPESTALEITPDGRLWIGEFEVQP